MKKYLYLIKNSKIPTYLKYWLMYSSKKISLLIQSLPITLENTIKDLKIVINKIYGNSEQESTEGRQLLPYPYVNTTKTDNGITFTDNGDGSITINGTSTNTATFFLLGGWSTTNNIPENMKKNISIKASGTNNVVIQASLLDSNGTPVTNKLYGNNETTNADVSTAVSGYIRILIPSGVTINNAIVKPYIVEGTYTTATFPEYEKYTGGEASPNPQFESPITNVTGDVEVVVSNSDNTKLQTFTFPLGNEKLMLGDYLADDGIHHVRRQVVFDGSESWGNNGESSDYGQYLLLINNKKYGATNIISNKFITKQSLAENSIAGRSNSNYIAVTVDKKIIPYSKDNFKTWLQTQYNNGTPVIIEYELEEEVIVPYTSAQQEVYNQIKQTLSYEGQTNISSNQNIYLDIDYIKRG